MPKNVKNTTLPSILDLIAPHSCRGCGCLGHALCNRCKNYISKTQHNLCPICKAPNKTGICPKCTNNSSIPNLPPVFIIGERSDLIESLIHGLKYESIRSLAHPLAELINQSLPQISNTAYIVPLPTIDRHIRSRGLDHTYLIAKHLSKFRQNFHLAKLLIRNNSSVQVGADIKTRQKQANEAYSINHKITIDKKATYILLDDVWTTGASMKSAISLLKKNGIESIIVAILALST